MQQNQEPWIELCRQAAVEMHPGKLLRLIHEINELFRAKREPHTNIQKPSE
jgi:7,8-dihydro-6-hydroxymethylpterin-pyrophosphokinase